MKKTRRRFVLYAVLAVFASLVILLGAINIVNFTMAADDADALTEAIATGEAGQLFDNPGQAQGNPPDGKPGRFGPMGTDSPEVYNSLRFFKISFDKEDNATLLNFRISAVTNEEAIAWAKSLKKETTGWTRGTYRYRVTKRDGVTYVTVIDQGRELLPAYRILILSVCGTLLGTLLSFIILRLVSKKLFAPLEDADRKQKKFIAAAEQEFKLPLTVISADLEIIERGSGSTEQTRSIHRQVDRMTALVKNVGDLNVFEDSKQAAEEFSLGELIKQALEKRRDGFEKAGLAIETDIDTVNFKGSREAFEKAFDEITENLSKYAQAFVKVSLKASNGRIKMCFSNGTTLKDGVYDQVFDRFVTLENAKSGSAGLGLTSVKNVSAMHNGRIFAKVENGVFMLGMDL